MVQTVEELGPYAVVCSGGRHPEDGALKVGISLAMLKEPAEGGKDL
jgi:hypothetical protein